MLHSQKQGLPGPGGGLPLRAPRPRGRLTALAGSQGATRGPGGHVCMAGVHLSPASLLPTPRRGWGGDGSLGLATEDLTVPRDWFLSQAAGRPGPRRGSWPPTRWAHPLCCPTFQAGHSGRGTVCPRAWRPERSGELEDRGHQGSQGREGARGGGPARGGRQEGPGWVGQLAEKGPPEPGAGRGLQGDPLRQGPHRAVGLPWGVVGTLPGPVGRGGHQHRDA